MLKIKRLSVKRKKKFSPKNLNSVNSESSWKSNGNSLHIFSLHFEISIYVILFMLVEKLVIMYLFIYLCAIKKS